MVDRGVLGRVVAVYPEARAVDLVMSRDGRRLRRVSVLGAMLTSASGAFHLHAPGPPSSPWDPQDVAEGLNVFAAVDFYDGVPHVVGFRGPETGEMNFKEENLSVDRHPSDVYSTLNDAGEIEFAFPNGTFLRIGLTPDHEDLTGKDFDKKFSIKRNKDAQLHLRLVLAGSDTPALDIHVTPAGIATVTLAGTATLTAESWTVNGPVHFTDAVTGDSSATFEEDVVGQGTSLHAHRHTEVESGADTSGPPE